MLRALPCGPANAIQAANSAVNGLTCDSQITINTTTHTISAHAIITESILVNGGDHRGTRIAYDLELRYHYSCYSGGIAGSYPLARLLTRRR